MRDPKPNCLEFRMEAQPRSDRIERLPRAVPTGRLTRIPRRSAVNALQAIPTAALVNMDFVARASRGAARLRDGLGGVGLI